MKFDDMKWSHFSYVYMKHVAWYVLSVGPGVRFACSSAYVIIAMDKLISLLRPVVTGRP